MSPERGVWMYAITERRHLSAPDGDVDLSWLAGVGGARVRCVTCPAGLAALASDVSLAEFGEAALRRNLENLDWLDEVARQHHYVIDAAARLFPLLPTRLATVYHGDAALCAALASRQGELRGALRRVEGRVEWGVKAYAAPEADAPAERDTGTGGGAGLAYLKRRRAQLTTVREARDAAVNAVQAVHAELTARAADTRLHPPQAAALSGVRLPMLLNAAYLLDKDDGGSFSTAVAGQASAHPELRIELTGPWPPYSFAAQDTDHESTGDDGH